MKPIFKTILFYIFLVPAAYLLAFGLANSILPPIFYSAFGEETGFVVLHISMRLIVIVVACAVIAGQKINNKTVEREYLKRIGNETYNAADAKEILRSRDMWIENIVIALLFIPMSFADQPGAWVLSLGPVVFMLMNFCIPLLLHRKWLAGRLHH